MDLLAKQKLAEQKEKEIVPEYVNILFKYIDKSITREWGPKPDGSIRYDSKYALWRSFKVWLKESSEYSKKLNIRKRITINSI